MSSDRDRRPVPQVLQSRHPTSAIIRHEIWNRLHKHNEHYQAGVFGREGKGKSGTALSIAEMVDPEMSADQAMFDPGTMLKQIYDWKEAGKTKGRMIVADEAGVGLGNRTWYDKDQIRFAQVLQLIRSENMGILFTVPRGSEMDSQVRGGRLHGQWLVQQKHEGDFVTTEYEKIQVGRRIDSDGLWTPKQWMNVEGVQRRIEGLKVGPPSDDLWEDYLELKQEFQREQYKDAAEEMGETIDDEDEVNELKQMANDLEDRLGDVVDKHGVTGDPKVNKDLIRMECDIGRTDANAVRSLLQKRHTKDELEEFI